MCRLHSDSSISYVLDLHDHLTEITNCDTIYKIRTLTIHFGDLDTSTVKLVVLRLSGKMHFDLLYVFPIGAHLKGDGLRS